LRKKIFRKSK